MLEKTIHHHLDPSITIMQNVLLLTQICPAVCCSHEHPHQPTDLYFHTTPLTTGAFLAQAVLLWQVFYQKPPGSARSCSQGAVPRPGQTLWQGGVGRALPPQHLKLVQGLPQLSKACDAECFADN